MLNIENELIINVTTHGSYIDKEGNNNKRELLIDANKCVQEFINYYYEILIKYPLMIGYDGDGWDAPAPYLTVLLAAHLILKGKTDIRFGISQRQDYMSAADNEEKYGGIIKTLNDLRTLESEVINEDVYNHIKNYSIANCFYIFVKDDNSGTKKFHMNATNEKWQLFKDQGKKVYDIIVQGDIGTEGENEKYGGYYTSGEPVASTAGWEFYKNSNGLPSILLVHWNENIMKYTQEAQGWESNSCISRSLYEKYSGNNQAVYLYPNGAQEP